MCWRLLPMCWVVVYLVILSTTIIGHTSSRANVKNKNNFGSSTNYKIGSPPRQTFVTRQCIAYRLHPSSFRVRCDRIVFLMHWSLTLTDRFWNWSTSDSSMLRTIRLYLDVHVTYGWRLMTMILFLQYSQLRIYSMSFPVSIIVCYSIWLSVSIDFSAVHDTRSKCIYCIVCP